MLNSDEIRDLLNNPANPAAGGGLWSGESAPYDFLKAALKKDEKLQAANTLHTQAAIIMAKHLSTLCERPVTVEFTAPEMVSSTDALSGLDPEQSLAFAWNDEAAGLEGLFVVERSLFFQVYNALFGGKKSSSRPGPLTALEDKFLKRMVAPLVETMQNAWKGNGNFRFNISKFLEDKAAVALLNWNFDCFRVNFKVTGEGLEGGVFSALLPRVMLNSIAEAAAGAEAGPETKAARDKQWVDAVTYAIADRPIPVSVTLGMLHIPVQKVLALKPGEEFPLLLAPKGQSVSINGRAAFRATIGTAEGCRAVRITEADGGLIDE